MPEPDVLPPDQSAAPNDPRRPAGRWALAWSAVRAVGWVSGTLGWFFCWAPLLLFLFGGAVLLALGQPPDVALCAAVGGAILGCMIRDTLGGAFQSVNGWCEQIDGAGGWVAEYRSLLRRYREYRRERANDPATGRPASERWLLVRFAVRESVQAAVRVFQAKIGTVLRGAALGAVLFAILGAACGWAAWGWPGAAVCAAVGLPLGAALGASWRLMVG
jgi:hypothetical protein